MKFDFRVLEAEGLGSVAPLVKGGSSMQEDPEFDPQGDKKTKKSKMVVRSVVTAQGGWRQEGQKIKVILDNDAAWAT